MPGYVYVMRAGDDLHKIGVSIDPEKRAKAISRGMPLDITVVQSWWHLSPYLIEAAIHADLRDKVVKSEWFKIQTVDAVNTVEAAIARCTPEMLATIKRQWPGDASIIGAHMAAKKRLDASRKAIKLIANEWPLPSKEYPTAALLARCGLSLNTVKAELGPRPIA